MHRYPFVLLDASQESRGDREVVMIAVEQGGYVLEYATEELRGDHEVVMMSSRP